MCNATPRTFKASSAPLSNHHVESFMRAYIVGTVNGQAGSLVIDDEILPAFAASKKDVGHALHSRPAGDQSPNPLTWSPLVRTYTPSDRDDHRCSGTLNVSPLAVRLISTVLPSEAAEARPSELTQRQMPARCHWIVPCSDSIRSSLRKACTSLSLNALACSVFSFFMVVGSSSPFSSPTGPVPPPLSRPPPCP